MTQICRIFFKNAPYFFTLCLLYQQLLFCWDKSFKNKQFIRIPCQFKLFLRSDRPCHTECSEQIADDFSGKILFVMMIICDKIRSA